MKLILWLFQLFNYEYGLFEQSCPFSMKCYKKTEYASIFNHLLKFLWQG